MNGWCASPGDRFGPPSTTPGILGIPGIWGIFGDRRGGAGPLENPRSQRGAVGGETPLVGEITIRMNSNDSDDFFMDLNDSDRELQDVDEWGELERRGREAQRRCVRRRQAWVTSCLLLAAYAVFEWHQPRERVARQSE
eukprot:GHVU01102367.1.p1 GENE.GHVU01102367.1~~GHVU01102367.1.p1  ORF type:complete len:139 (-),score=4.07 GHVU01102367.1:5-421(-)